MNQTDYYTIKYNSSGTEQWNIRGDGDSHLIDKATDIATDTTGNLIVTGESMKSDGSYEYKTIRYVEHSVVTPTDYDSEVAQVGYDFYENKGQLLNTSDTLVPSIRYYTENSSPQHYIRNNASSFVFARIDSDTATADTVHRIDMTFNQVNAGAKVYSMEPKDDYVNYFLSHLSEGITRLHPNSHLITTDLYSNIDLEYSSNQNGIKYYFIIKPGGSPSAIKIEYTIISLSNPVAHPPP
jgi:hypothetical protein